MTRHRLLRRSPLAAAVLAAALAPRLRRGSELPPAGGARAPEPSRRRGHGRRGVPRGRALVAGLRRSRAPASHQRVDRLQLRPARGLRAGGRGPGAGGGREVLPLPADRLLGRLHGPAGLAELRPRAGGRRRQDLPELQPGLQPLLGDRPLRADPAGEGIGVRPVPRQRAGPTRRPHDGRGRRGVLVLPASRARPGARDRPTHLEAQRRNRELLLEPAARAGSPTGSRSTRPRPTAPSRPPPSPTSSGRSPSPRTRSACSSAVSRDRSTAGAALTEQHFPPSVPAGIPATLLERRPDVAQAEDFLVSANADVGAAKALFFPDDQPDRAPGRREPRPFERREGGRRRVVAGSRHLPAHLPGRADQAELRGGEGALRPGHGAIPEGGAQRLPRGGRLAGHDREAAERADRAGEGRRRPARRVQARPLALRHRAFELPRDPDRGPIALPAGAAGGPDAGGRVRGPGPALPGPGRGLAAGGRRHHARPASGPTP